MSAMKILFAGTPEPAAYALRRLIDDANLDVVGVITQPDAKRGRGRSLHPSKVAEVADEHGIPVHTDAVQAVGAVPVDLDGATVPVFGQLAGLQGGTALDEESAEQATASNATPTSTTLPAAALAAVVALAFAIVVAGVVAPRDASPASVAERGDGHATLEG